jgi:hypothetical protein
MIVSLLIAALIVLALYVGSHRLSGGTTALMLGLAILGGVLVVFPGVTSRVATWLGVGRGTDLLLYFAIVAGLFVCANLYFRIKKQEQRIAELSRAVALVGESVKAPLPAPRDQAVQGVAHELP